MPPPVTLPIAESHSTFRMRSPKSRLTTVKTMFDVAVFFPAVVAVTATV